MSLLDLVEEHHAERLAAHLLGELAALLVADIARRRAEEPGSGVLLGVLAHIQLDQRVLVAEQELSQRLGQLGLADTGWAGEDERAAGSLRVLQARPGTPDRAGERLDRVVLADIALADLLLHPQQPGRLFLGQLEHRDAGRGGQHLGDDLLIHLGDDVKITRLPLRLTLGAGGQQLLLVIAETGSALEVLGVDGGFLLQPYRGHLLVELPQVRRSGHPPDPQPRARLVDQVDRLVGQEAIRDVPVGHLSRGDQRLISDGDPVVRLVAVAQPTQDVDGVRDGRLCHLDRLEAPLQRGVLLHVLPILVQRGSADGLQFTASQHRLEDAGGVDRALGCAGADQGVDLIDEQHDVAAGLDLLQHLLQALLEIAAITAAGNQRTEVEGVNLLISQCLGNIAADDCL